MGVTAMKLKTIVFGFLFILAIGVVAARPWSVSNNYAFNDNYQRLEAVIETGDYQDLVQLREDTGINFMPWVDSPDEFELIQEHHQNMEQYWYGPMYRNTNSYAMNYGYGIGPGRCMYR